MRRTGPLAFVIISAIIFTASTALAQTATVSGTVHDETGGVLPGVSVELRSPSGTAQAAVTDATGSYRIDGVASDRYQLSFSLINFASARRDVVAAGAAIRVDVVMHLALNADVVVTGKRTFTNLADAENPAEDLVGIAQSASQGAITARQLDARPVMRTGEVLETVPGVVISQHSGEGKANQYYLRGFNLDHGTDLATTVAGMPVNLPTHAHGQGYSDLNFMIPELVSGVQFSKGPYFADQGDFATAGAANINYVNVLDHAMARVSGGDEGFGRAIVAGSSAAGRGRLLAALEVEHSDGPWVNPDAFKKVNGVVRYSLGNAVNDLAITGMAYRGTWNSTDQVPQRAVDSGLINRFGALDPSDGGDSYRYSGSVEWQHSNGNATTKVTAYGIGYDLSLFSNFTFFLDDSVHGDQLHQADHRFITGGKVSYRRIDRWQGHEVQNTVGVQVRNDDIANVGLYHTQQRNLLDVIRQDAVVETSGAVYAQNEIAWSPWLRTLAGARVDGYRFNIAAGDPVNGGTETAGLVSPKGGAVLGPWKGTEIYGNGGFGFHSNDARGTTITRDPSTGETADRVTPLVRAKGAEVGVRTVAIPHAQSSVSVWSLNLDSELVFTGDAGTTEASRPSRRYGVEWANYLAPRPWLIFDGDVSWSQAHFTDFDPAGDRIPGSVQTVISAGATLDSLHNVFGSVRLRYFGPRALIEDGSVRSKATALLNLEAGYKLSARVRFGLDVFNLLDAADSDIDYYYTSRLRGEPADGVDDIHLHPTLPRTARISLTIGF
ncbi:MAG: TonB-dependent receptor [Acidobacteria bacterium]|nr:TonB-dependent receptor [Acidobacteriota bacterium]